MLALRDTLMAAAIRQAPALQPRHLATIISSSAHMRYPLRHALHPLLVRAHALLAHMGPADVCALCTGLLKHRVHPGKDWVDYMVEVTQPLLPEFQVGEASREAGGWPRTLSS